MGWWSAGLATLGVAGVAASAWAGLSTWRGQMLDERARMAATLPRSMMRIVIEVLTTVSVGMIAVALLVLLITALIRGRWLAGLVAVVLVGGANVTTQVLKYVIFQRPDLGLGDDNTLPSGHTTALASLALAAIIVLPRSWRTLSAFAAAAVATFVGAGTVLNGWHRPSDVVAAFGVCAAWAGLALVVAAGWLRLRPAEAGELDRSYRHPAMMDRLIRTARRPGVLRGFGRYLVAGLLGSAGVGVFLIVGGMTTRGTANDLLLGTLALSAVGVSAAVMTSAVAAVTDGLGSRERVAEAYPGSVSLSAGPSPAS